MGKARAGYLTVLILLSLPGAVPAREPEGFPSQASYGQAVCLPAAAFLAGSYELSFSPEGPWSRPLVDVILDAFAGEDRPYELWLRNDSGTIRLNYRIDRRPPAAPVLLPPSGWPGSFVKPELKGDGTLFVSVDGGSFKPWTAFEPPSFSSYDDASRTVRLAAYAVDDAGNASALVHGAWILCPDGFTPSAASVAAASGYGNGAISFQKAASGSIRDVRAGEDAILGVVLSFTVPEGAEAYAAVSPAEPLDAPWNYARVPGIGREARVVIPFACGDTRAVSVYPAYRSSDGLFFRGEKLLVSRTGASADGSATLYKAPAPVLDESGPVVTVVWPTSSARVFVSLDAKPFDEFTVPLALDRSGSDRALSYYAQYGEGIYAAKSPVESLTIKARYEPSAPVLKGVEHGGRYGGPVSVGADSGLRYEVAMGGQEPAPLGGASPTLASGARFEGMAGTTQSYALRAASISGEGIAGEERLIRFVIDREPPPVPALVRSPFSSDENDALVEFAASEGTIFVSVSPDGRAPFSPYQGPFDLGTRDEGRKIYIVRAYAQDELGNRSAEMPPMSFLVDRDSVYLASDGKPGARGTMDAPLATLDEAIERAKALGKGTINVRGAVRLSRAVVIERDVRIVGGFDSSWEERPGARTVLDLSAAPGDGGAFLRVRGARLSIEKLDIAARATGSYSVIACERASLAISSVGMTVSGGLDSCFFNVRESSLVLESSFLASTASVTSRVVYAADSSLAIRDTSVDISSGVMLHEFLRARGGSLELSSLRMEARPSQAFSAFSLSGLEARMTGLSIFARGGSSSCKILELDAARADLTSVYADIDWKGEAALLSLARGASLRLGYSTILAKAGGFTFLAIDSSTATVAASIVHADSPRARFLVSNGPVVPESILANCLWGFSAYVDAPLVRGRAFTDGLAALNAYASAEYPNFSERPELTFSGSIKGYKNLSRQSACAESAPPLSWAPALDVNGSALPTGGTGIRPSVGAQQF